MNVSRLIEKIEEDGRIVNADLLSLEEKVNAGPTLCQRGEGGRWSGKEANVAVLNRGIVLVGEMAADELDQNRLRTGMNPFKRRKHSRVSLERRGR